MGRGRRKASVDDTLREFGVNPADMQPEPAPVAPTGMAETGRRQRVIEVPGFSFEVDPTGRRRARTTRMPGEVETVEHREVAPRGMGDLHAVERTMPTPPPEPSLDQLIRSFDPETGRFMPRLIGGDRTPQERELRASANRATSRVNDAALLGMLEPIPGTADEEAGGIPVPEAIASRTGIRSVPVTPAGIAHRIRTGQGLERTREQARDAQRARMAADAVPSREALAVRAQSGGIGEPGPGGAYGLGQLASATTLGALIPVPGAGTAGLRGVLARVGGQAAIGGGMGAIQGAGEAPTAAEVPDAALTRGLQSAALAGGLSAGMEGAGGLLSRLGPWADRLRLPAARARMGASGIRQAADVDMIDDPVRAAEILRETDISRGLRSTRAAGERAEQVRSAANAGITALQREARQAGQRATAAGTYRGGPGQAQPGMVRIEDIERRLTGLAGGIEGQGAPAVGARSEVDALLRRYTDAYPQGDVPIDPMMADWRAFGNPENFREGQPWNVLAGSRRGLRGEFRGLMEQAMESASGPGARDQLGSALERVHVARTAQRGARRAARRAGGNRQLSPTDYLAMMAGLGGAGAGAAMADPVTALGSAAGAVVINRAVRGREHAISATALEGLSGALRAMGPRAQGWANTLDGAARRGPVALAAAHATLQRTSPEYRQTLQQVEEGGGEQPEQDAAAVDALLREQGIDPSQLEQEE